MHELWSLLNFMYPSLFMESEMFDNVYKQSDRDMECDKSLLCKTPMLLYPIYMRRLKSDVELSLPGKEEIILKIPMSKSQLFWYKTFLANHANLIDEMTDKHKNNNNNNDKNETNRDICICN